MNYILYNTLQITLLALFWPVLLAVVVCTPKYRRRALHRLGAGLSRLFTQRTRSGDAPVFWVHALSVGEVTSAAPLVSGIRDRFPTARIIVTTTTETGEKVASTLMANTADRILPGPVDLLPVVKRFIQIIQPDIFILVETDFWPNLMTQLHRQKIPTLLVNGRISQKSMAAYQKYSFFFFPIFQQFTHLCMQTTEDKQQMHLLGIPEDKISTLGNLKFGGRTTRREDLSAAPAFLPKQRCIFIAGSTHPGEESLILEAYSAVKSDLSDLYLVIAPRNPDRAEEISKLASDFGIHCCRRTHQQSAAGDALILDTVGELSALYAFCNIAYVGGSLVPEGGHNPIEPATAALPVIFGPHMDDFSEIARDLLQCGGAVTVSNCSELAEALHRFALEGSTRRQYGNAAHTFVFAQQGILEEHLDLIHSLL